MEDQYCQSTSVEIVCGSSFVKQPNNTYQDPIPVKCLKSGSLNTSAMCFPGEVFASGCSSRD